MLVPRTVFIHSSFYSHCLTDSNTLIPSTITPFPSVEPQTSFVGPYINHLLVLCTWWPIEHLKRNGLQPGFIIFPTSNEPHGPAPWTWNSYLPYIHHHYLFSCVSFVAICSSFPHWIGLPRLPTWIQPSLCSTPMLSPAFHRALLSVPLHQSRGSSPTPPNWAHQPLGTTAVCALVYVRDISCYLSLSILGTMHNAWHRAFPKFGGGINDWKK